MDFPSFEINFSNENWINDDELVSEVQKIEKENQETEKSRFVTLNEDDLLRIVTDAEAKGTKRNTKWIVNTIEGKA